ncbi:hypothetical protein V5E97_30020 [Singulisphaera sp. Ch08]|uniref:Squalene cyclase C-terminal domain-containing protein n=1 Tax=Singulisphaera sp. Ch08 TaxID=3120278 RepID=A0AAU7CBN6_9BACT
MPESRPVRAGITQADAEVVLRQSRVDQSGTRADDPRQDLGILSWELMALATGEQIAGDRSQGILERSVAILRASQWDDTRGCPRAHPYYGGTGRDEKSAPDLPHTSQSVQALRTAGVPADDPLIQRAVVFISRCQRLGGRSDLRPEAGDGDVGGLTFEPYDTMLPKRGDARSSRRPCGAATCMGLTSLLAAGIPAKDARIQGALRWLQTHYSLDHHPGMTRANDGLYRYYYEFAKAMRSLGQDELRDACGVVHNWRGELAQRLAARQRPDGSWANPEESAKPAWCGPVTITSYALLTLNQIGDSSGQNRRRGRGPTVMGNIAW